MKNIYKIAVATVATLLVCGSVIAAPSTNAPVVPAAPAYDVGKWTLSLAGSGLVNTATDNKSSAFAGDLSLGRVNDFLFFKNNETGVRQTVGYSSSTVEKWHFKTALYDEVRLLKVGNVELDAGGRIGGVYGDTKLGVSGGPEATGRLYLTKNTDVFLRGGYDFDLYNAQSVKNKVDLALGLRVKF